MNESASEFEKAVEEAQGPDWATRACWAVIGLAVSYFVARVVPAVVQGAVR